MFDDRLNDFIHYLRFEKRYSPHTLLSYENDLRSFRDFLATTYNIEAIEIVTHFHIRGWLAEMKDQKFAARTLNRKLSSLSAFYRYMRKNGLVENNPVRKLHSQKLPERLPVSLKTSETDTLLEEIQFESGFGGHTDRVICELLYSTGMRRNELQQLKENDVEWSMGQVRVMGKGGKERLVPMSAATADMLREYIAEKRRLHGRENNWLLVLPSGEQLYANYIYRCVKKYLGEATTMKKKSPHVLRHTFATHLLNNGANIQAIKDLLGHSSLAATQIYTHNNIDKLKEIHKLNHPRG
ncbi:MAG: tyrosine-type recombinase/integrase [Taibaiella sp.]|nr:tyrosine-type recombinase/integrase [Taibaiella sp.]